MEDLDTLVATAKTMISEIIQKPKMTEKLLSKPPFRFIHDTISALNAQLGFIEGLYSGPELDSAAITEKQAKLNYLDKIFAFVGICKGAQLEVRSSKVIQGLEAEFTNKFFIALVEVATNQSLDHAEAVRRCLAGEEPGQSPPPLKRAQAPPQAESKSQEPPLSAPSAKGQASEKEERRFPPENLETRLPPEIEQAVAPERGKSRGGTRGGKPNQSTADAGLGGFTAAAPNLDAEIEKCDGLETTTQAMLGQIITRPKLTEKLLGKPPVRFLHDVVMEVMRATGFATGLYNSVESDSANMTDKAQKINFLNKIIRLVGVQLNTLVQAKPELIVSGLDAQNTNNFLQLLAVAAKHVPDSTNAVRTVLEQFGELPPRQEEPPLRSESKETASIPQTARFEPPQQQQPIVEDSKMTEQRNSTRSAAPSVVAEAKETAAPVNNFRQEERREFSPDDKENDAADGDTEQKRSARPTTARRRPPKVKDGAKEVQAAAATTTTSKKTNIIIDGAADDDDIDAIPDETRLADDLKSDSKTDDPILNPQSKLVQDIMSRQAEQEAATRPNRTEIVDESKTSGNDGSNAGSGIRLGKLRKTGLDKKGATSSAAATFAEADLEKMRGAIQSLVQQTGPLGTCMDFIQEDISLMTSELHKWEEECRKYENEYEEAKRKTKETLHPLKVELADLEDQIAEQIAKISSAKATNARNDDKIQQILKLVATA